MSLNYHYMISFDVKQLCAKIVFMPLGWQISERFAGWLAVTVTYGSLQRQDHTSALLIVPIKNTSQKVLANFATKFLFYFLIGFKKEVFRYACLPHKFLLSVPILANLFFRIILQNAYLNDYFSTTYVDDVPILLFVVENLTRILLFDKKHNY